MKTLNHIGCTNTVSIFGNNWVEVDGISYICQHLKEPIFVKQHYSLTEIFNQIHTESNEKIIIIAQPHECAYFLYKLVTLYPRVKFIILADIFYFSDQVILKTLALTSSSTFNQFFKHKFTQLFRMPVREPCLLPEWDKPAFLSYMNEKILAHLPTRGVTRRQQEVLTFSLVNLSIRDIANAMNITNKTASTYKLKGLMKLPHGNSRFCLTKGLQARCVVTGLHLRGMTLGEVT